jgi:hypothetical protein
MLNEDNNHQTDLQERIKNANKTYFMLKKCFRNEYIHVYIKNKIKTKEHADRQNFNICHSNLDGNKER